MSHISDLKICTGAFSSEPGDALSFQPACNDAAEAPTQHSTFPTVLELIPSPGLYVLVSDIQCDTVACNAPANLDTHGANLALATADPDPGIHGRSGVRDGKAGAGAHHGVLEEGDVGAGRDACPAKVEERVGGQLARAVEGEVTAARSEVEGGEVG